MTTLLSLPDDLLMKVFLRVANPNHNRPNERSDLSALPLTCRYFRDMFRGAVFFADFLANAFGSCGKAVCVAACYGKTEVVRNLCGRRLDNVNAVYALHGASRNGHVEVVRTLLEHGADAGADDNRLPLHVASKNGHVNVVRILLEHGADARGFTAMWLASKYGHVEVVRTLLEHGADNLYSGLLYACEHGHVEVVRLLLEHGADSGAYDNRALRLASQNGHVEVVRTLLEHGADAGADYNSALHVASQNGHV
jgi:ankyrin repeat protein